jgi:ribonuclease HI
VCAEALCPICLQEEETIEHIVWECISAADVWGASNVKVQKCPRGGGDFQHILLEMVNRCGQEGVELFMVIARKIWMRHNQVVFSGEFNPPKALLMEAEMVLSEFRKSNLVTNETRAIGSSIEEEKWTPPPRNTVKINWDATVAIEKKEIGIGFIARDEKGKFVGAVSKKERIAVEPVVAETLAALFAILWCQEQNYHDVILEGDALQVVNAVNNDRQCSSYYGHLVEDVKLGLRRLNCTKFCHVRHSANAAAHELAFLARTHVTEVINWNFLPPCISDIVQREGLYSTS